MAHVNCSASIPSTSPTKASSLPSSHRRKPRPGSRPCGRIRLAPTRPKLARSSPNRPKPSCYEPDSAAPGSSTCSSATHCPESAEERGAQMCLGIPGRIVEITDPANYLAKVDVSGVQRTISVRLLEDDMPEPDDWVLVHVGFAMAKIDETEALLTLAAIKKLGDAYATEMDAFDSSAII